MSIEFEVKFAATQQAQAAIAAAWPGPSQTITMETTYYDAPGGALSARHITLRRRMENGRSVCTVKTPAPGLARGEWECVCDDVLEAVPHLCEFGAPRELLLLTAAGLEPVCGARFTRQAILVELENATAELALDRGVLLGAGKEIPLCEVEVELKSGDPQAVVAFGRELAEKFCLEPQSKSKFRRALALARGE